ncbi:MAG: glycosyl hydrolase-related protein, partial [Spirochaetes bacterium]|nr:glycosyl hydrolase-related protein [Spirochaetota bacterium]
MAHIKVERRSMSLKQWTKVMFSQVESMIIQQSLPTGLWQMRKGCYFPENYVWLSDWENCNEGDLWGGPDITTVFHCDCTIPHALKSKKVFLYMLTSAEVMVKVNGQWLDGIDPNRQYVELTSNATGGERFSIQLEAYSRSKPDDERNPKTSHLQACVQRFDPPELVVLDEFIQEVFYDLDLLYHTAFNQAIKEDVTLYLQSRVKELLKLFPPYDSPPELFQTALPGIKEFLEKNIYNSSSPFTKEGKLACVAHSHLDVAYFWKVVQTIQKNARTTLIQMKLMERWPEFRYAHTQSWCYETLEKYYPEIFSQLKKYIAQGRWEIVGGLYVEPDCNVISAESLVRQILYGKSYFLEKFNIEVDNCWLPDVFGNSAIMPQILKLGGIDYFVSNKMSTWNDTNRFPHNNFVWRGIDGSEVYAVVPPVHFITWMDPGQAAENWEAMQDKEIFAESLQMYGYGDGGSGVTDEMLHWFYRQQKLPGIPQQRLITGKEYLHSTFKDKKNLPVWDGDLYLEMHRGTFTTRAALKKANRQGEYLLSETETLCSLANLIKNHSYPLEKLKKCWKQLLINQFHDIIPGSHTEPVFKEALETYEEMNQDLKEIKFHSIKDFTLPDTSSITIMNHTSWQRKELVIIDDYFSSFQFADNNALLDESQRFYPVQKQVCSDGRSRMVIKSPIMKGYQAITLKKGGQKDFPVTLICNKNQLENDWYRIELSKEGIITQILDKKRNHLVGSGEPLNQWQLFEDCPGRYNAWDILDRYEDKPIPIQSGWDKITVCETGPVSAAIKLERHFENSHAIQIIRIYQDFPRIDFETWIDWQEKERLLKVAFPLQVKSRYYSTDLSAGVLELPTTRNTSWEQAHFESLCHKWVDLSEGNFGVSLINDSKYGCDAKDNLLRLTLLRAPIRPDPRSDRGEHCFTYSLYCHDGQWQASELQDLAYALNDPLKGYTGRKYKKNSSLSPFEINTNRIKVQALKMSEDNQGSLVIRLLENSGSHQSCVLKLKIRAKEANVCDLLERPLEKKNLIKED